MAEREGFRVAPLLAASGAARRAFTPLPRCRSKLDDNDENSTNAWRRGRDSNPRWAFDPYALSRGAPSTTRPPLRTGNQAHSRSAGSYLSAAVQVKLKAAKRFDQASSTILAAGAPDRESLPSSRLMRS